MKPNKGSNQSEGESSRSCSNNFVYGNFTRSLYSDSDSGLGFSSEFSIWNPGTYEIPGSLRPISHGPTSPPALISHQQIQPQEQILVGSIPIPVPITMVPALISHQQTWPQEQILVGSIPIPVPITMVPALISHQQTRPQHARSTSQQHQPQQHLLHSTTDETSTVFSLLVTRKMATALIGLRGCQARTIARKYNCSMHVTGSKEWENQVVVLSVKNSTALASEALLETHKTAYTLGTDALMVTRMILRSENIIGCEDILKIEKTTDTKLNQESDTRAYALPSDSILSIFGKTESVREALRLLANVCNANFQFPMSLLPVPTNKKARFMHELDALIFCRMCPRRK